MVVLYPMFELLHIEEYMQSHFEPENNAPTAWPERWLFIQSSIFMKYQKIPWDLKSLWHLSNAYISEIHSYEIETNGMI